MGRGIFYSCYVDHGETSAWQELQELGWQLLAVYCLAQLSQVFRAARPNPNLAKYLSTSRQIHYVLYRNNTNALLKLDKYS